MGYSTPDVYNQPEHFNLEVIFEEDIGGSYQFDTFVVLRHKETHKLYHAIDAGCSCPAPFENHISMDDLTPIDSLQQFETDFKAWGTGNRYGENINEAVVEERIEQIRKLLEELE